MINYIPSDEIEVNRWRSQKTEGKNSGDITLIVGKDEKYYLQRRR
ncbi:MAG: hypothetical protein Q9N34_04230 [Aquificota bacterium]|nr:hypothetical protein [Aquificota bacterium]